MRLIMTIFVVVFTIILNAISNVHSQEGGSGVAFEAPPGPVSYTHLRAHET